MSLPKRPFIIDAFMSSTLCLLASTDVSAQSALLFEEVRIVSANGSVAAKSADGKTSPIAIPRSTTNGSVAEVRQNAGSTLATGAGSSAVIRAPGIGKVIMGPETQMRLPKASEAGSSLELLKGRLFLEIDPAAVKKRGAATFRLKTPAALLAVKGTRFFAISEGGTDTAGVHQGVVIASTDANTQGLEVTAGNAINLAPGQAIVTRPLNPTEVGYQKLYDFMLLSAGNSLEMRFVPVPGSNVMFCIHETRRRDYEAFVAENATISTFWKKQFSLAKMNDDPAWSSRLPDHPVRSISWNEAKQFCEWLSIKEGRNYRLPTDREWSLAVGIGDQEKNTGSTPEDLDGKIKNMYPWGDGWPPKSKSGNYADKSAKQLGGMPIVLGSNDGFPESAPVMSFQANKLGIHDMGGNVSEWCDDWYNAGQNERVIRGGCYLDFEKSALLSSDRYPYIPAAAQEENCFGFRVVVETAPATP
jgi:hypothetical protein